MEGIDGALVSAVSQHEKSWSVRTQPVAWVKDMDGEGLHKVLLWVFSDWDKGTWTKVHWLPLDFFVLNQDRK